MIFRMDTDSVRAMAARFRRTADRMDGSLTSIRQSVRSAPWQSQAREEFVQQLEMLHNSTLRSAEVLRLMALAAEQKANQWEAIGDRFNGPWQAMGNAWGQLKSMMGWLWSRIKNAVRGIKWPSVPKYLVPSGIGVGIIGGLKNIIPPWKFIPPVWWPFKGDNIYQPQSDVLGEHAINYSENLIDLENMTWREKLNKLQELQAEYNLIITNVKSDPEFLEARIADLDKQIAHVEQAMLDAQRESGKFVNQFIKQDGKPLSDIYDRVEQDYQRQLNQLHSMRNTFQKELDHANQANVIKNQINDLSSVINNGIPSDGPTSKGISSLYSGCTNYVSRKRDVSGWSSKQRYDAHLWNNKAQDAGYEVGEIPVKGSIMVFEADSGKDNGIYNVHDTAGHVAYVEDVIITDEGYKVLFSHGGYDEGVTKPGTYKTLPPDDVTIPFTGHEDVSFIYDKPS